VREALTGVSTAVSIANSIPFVRERAPAVEKIDAAFNQVGELAADARQLRSTLRAAATGQADQLTEEAATTLTNLTSRIDSRLAEIQANVEEVQAEIQALQVRLENLKKTVLLIFNLLALLATLLFLWVIYSQFVVIRHHARLFREPAASAPALAAGSAETSGRAGDGQAVQPSDEVAAPVPAALAPAADAPAAIKPPEETAGGSGEAPAGEPLAEAPAETAPDAQPPEAQPPNVGA